MRWWPVLVTECQEHRRGNIEAQYDSFFCTALHCPPRRPTLVHGTSHPTSATAPLALTRARCGRADNGPAGSRRTGTTTLDVLVLDVNDNRPLFLEGSYEVSVPENVTRGAIILQASPWECGRAERARVCVCTRVCVRVCVSTRQNNLLPPRGAGRATLSWAVLWGEGQCPLASPLMASVTTTVAKQGLWTGARGW